MGKKPVVGSKPPASSKPAPKAKANAASTQPTGLMTLIAAGCCVLIAWEVWRRSIPGDGGLNTLHTQQCGRYGSAAVPHCSPTGKACGRIVIENFATPGEVDALRALADRGMALGGGAGGPTILDLQSGALSYQDKFIDVWSAFNASSKQAFTKSDVAVYADVVERVRQLAERTFGVGASKSARPRRLHLTAPTFFSRISGEREPKTQHDEYWHTHIDLEQYGSFVFTSLLYLADGGVDFEGGDFEFLPKGSAQELADGSGPGAAGTPLASVTPRRGMLVLFSSGPEHPHRVTRVRSGTRLAITIAFTCDEAAAITDFLGRSLPDEDSRGTAG